MDKAILFVIMVVSRQDPTLDPHVVKVTSSYNRCVSEAPLYNRMVINKKTRKVKVIEEGICIPADLD